MIRFFENEDKYGILELAAQYNGEDFDLGTFAGLFDDAVNGSESVKGISVLHAGEYLGYCIIELQDKTLTVKQLYIKPEFQNKKVAPQVFDFIEAEFPAYSYKALCPKENKLAVSVFSKRGYEVTVF